MLIKADLLLNWYDKKQRNLPWRYSAHEKGNDYHTLLSEFLLQQTQVNTVISYFLRFVSRWPTLSDLANSSLDEVLQEWQGLGYYSRARNLHACVKTIVENYNGIIPKDEKVLLSLPGIGPYTAAAISAIAFNQPAVVVDGNIARIISRVYGDLTPIKLNPKIIYQHASECTPNERPGDYAQALMDIGASICKPKIALCRECPLSEGCKAQSLGNPLEYPQKLPTKKKPTYYAVSFRVENSNGILVRKRTHNKMLRDLWELPGNNWEIEKSVLPVVEFSEQAHKVIHEFSHFTLVVYAMPVTEVDPKWLNGTEKYVSESEFLELPLSSLTRKIFSQLENVKNTLLLKG
jgi:A/G-specific adenine glycosylase